MDDYGQRPRSISPSKGGREIDKIVAKLNLEHSLRLISRLHNEPGPLDYHQRAALTLLQFLQHNDKALLDKALTEFNSQAAEIRSGWVYKPKADRDVLPKRSYSMLPANGHLEQHVIPNIEEQLRSLLLSKLEDAKTQHFASGRPRQLPLRLSQEQASLPVADYLPANSHSASLPGSSMDEEFRNFDMAYIGMPEANNSEPSTVHLERHSDFDEDQSMTDVEDVFQTPPESPSAAQLARETHSAFAYPAQTGVTRKRESPESNNEKASRKRSMQSNEIPSPSPRRLFAKPHVPAEASDGSIAYSESDLSTTMTSANTSFTTEATSISFGEFNPYVQSKHSLDSKGTLALKHPHDKTINRDRVDGEHTNIPESKSNMAPHPNLYTRRDLASEANLRKRLEERSPLCCDLDKSPINVPFRIRYEVCRVALHFNLPTEDIFHYLDSLELNQLENYHCLWKHLMEFAARHSEGTLEKSQTTAWEAAGERECYRVAFKGELQFSDNAKDPLFQLRLKPLALEDSYRLARRFGFDRFMILHIPSLEPRDLPKHITCNGEAARKAIVEWLVESTHYLLGREWRAFYVKPRANKTVKGSSAQWRVYTFAVNGQEFRPSGYDPKAHSKVPLEDLLKWFIDFETNMEAPALKLFSRFQLAVSATTPTLVFESSQIIRCDDCYSASPRPRRLGLSHHYEHSAAPQGTSRGKMMSDGCARISQAAAKAVAEQLGIFDHVPSAFQARIGGGKGVWVVDLLGENLNGDPIWIEITDSQLKFEGHYVDRSWPDPRRFTFEVLNFSKMLKPAVLNFQLMPILIDRGIPQGVFERLLQEDLKEKAEHLEAAIQDPLSLRAWNQENNPTTGPRMEKNDIEYEGGLPKSTPEQINALTESGFSPTRCQFLGQLLMSSMTEYCKRVAQRMHVELGQSTKALMVPDFTGVLEEDEVHVGFSSKFQDSKSGFSDTMIDDCHVLIARNPAALPSDIHKVKAVFRRELAKMKDVIVFPTKGQFSLAEKLSGGDFDGDIAWICWDPDVVDRFQNCNMPQPKSPEWYGISKDTEKVKENIRKDTFYTDFIRKGFLFSMRKSLLGVCTNYHEGYCYDLFRRRKFGSMGDPQAVEIGQLLGHLVDTTKNGYTFTDRQWDLYKSKNGLPRVAPIPAYKCEGARPSNHIIDYLSLTVAPELRQRTLKKFEKPLKDAPEKDVDLVQIARTEENAARSDKELRKVLSHLKSQLDGVYERWMIGNRDVNSKRITFEELANQVRELFKAIEPWPAAQSSEPPKSTLIQRWIDEHGNPDTNYSTQNSWSLVKASTLYCSRFLGKYAWYACGRELEIIKATVVGNCPSLTTEMHRHLKPNRKMLEHRNLRRTHKGQPNKNTEVYIPELDSDELMGEDYAEAFETLSWAE